MNKITFLILGFFGLVFVLSQSACRRCEDPTNPDCPNYDACYGFKNASAEIAVTQTLFYNYYQRIVVNALEPYYLNPGTLKFEAVDEEVDSCFWRIGADPRIFTGKSLGLDFYDYPLSDELRVELIVVKKLPENCTNTSFVLRDTSVEYIKLVPDSITLIRGRYLGHNTDDPSHEFVVSIKDTLIGPGGIGGRTPIYIFNLPEGCYIHDVAFNFLDDWRLHPFCYKSYTNFVFQCDGWNAKCRESYGFGKLDTLSNEINIEYWTIPEFNSSSQSVKRKFTGHKIL